MPATKVRRENLPFVESPGRPTSRIPPAVFQAAYRELCTRIWIELELLAQAAAQFEHRRAHDLLIDTEILRLELVVLADSCRSSRWRRMLSEEQRHRLCSMLTDVLGALYIDPEQLRAGIAEAQGRILDELLPEAKLGPAGADWEFALELMQSSHPAVDELVRAIQAQAAAGASQ